MLQQHWHFRGVDRDAFSPELSQIPLKFSAFSWNSKIRKVWVFFLNTMSSYTVYLSLSFLWIRSGTPSCPNQAECAQLQAELGFSGESREHELIFMTLKFQRNIRVWGNIWSAQRISIKCVQGGFSHETRTRIHVFVSWALGKRQLPVEPLQ